MKYLKIFELFNSDNTYTFTKTEDKKYDDGDKTLRYEFTTKDDVIYKILLSFYPNASIDNEKTRVLRADFSTSGYKSSSISLINMNDSIKVFATLKSLLDSHRSEFDKLFISSTPERIIFYKKMFTHMGMEITELDDYQIVIDYD